MHVEEIYCKRLNPCTQFHFGKKKGGKRKWRWEEDGRGTSKEEV